MIQSASSECVRCVCLEIVGGWNRNLRFVILLFCDVRARFRKLKEKRNSLAMCLQFQFRSALLVLQCFNFYLVLFWFSRFCCSLVRSIKMLCSLSVRASCVLSAEPLRDQFLNQFINFVFLLDGTQQQRQQQQQPHAIILPRTDWFYYRAAIVLPFVADTRYRTESPRFALFPKKNKLNFSLYLLQMHFHLTIDFWRLWRLYRMEDRRLSYVQWLNS